MEQTIEYEFRAGDDGAGWPVIDPDPVASCRPGNTIWTVHVRLDSDGFEFSRRRRFAGARSTCGRWVLIAEPSFGAPALNIRRDADRMHVCGFTRRQAALDALADIAQLEHDTARVDAGRAAQAAHTASLKALYR